MDGLDATQNIRGWEGHLNQNIPIIALTAWTLTEEKQEAMATGMNDFLSKPLELDKIREIIYKYFL
jgi:CheY-like chemotaxis protein